MISRRSYPVSALRGQNTDLIIDLIFQYLPEGPMFYDVDTITDQPDAPDRCGAYP